MRLSSHPLSLDVVIPAPRRPPSDETPHASNSRRLTLVVVPVGHAWSSTTPTLTLARLSLAQPRKHTDPEQDMQGYLLDAGEELARVQD
jgi:hypothetical protein